MKALLKVVNLSQPEAFQLMKVDEPYFFPSWHFHPEFEIMLVLQGTGTRFAGDSMEPFEPGDLVFYGKGIPHFYRSNGKFNGQDKDVNSKAIVLYFREDFLGEKIWNVPDISHFKKLFSNAKRGIKFRGKAKETLIDRIKKIDDQKDGIAKVIDLLSILQIMARTHEYDLLSSIGFTHSADEDECKRMNNVYQYLINHYADNPTLEEVSKVAYMNANAFCRYFKSRTDKTYTRFLNEIKIGNACKLLIDNKMSISQVCFEIGFNNFTHFNSQFKRIVGITPTQYQQKHLVLA